MAAKRIGSGKSNVERSVEFSDGVEDLDRDRRKLLDVSRVAWCPVRLLETAHSMHHVTQRGAEMPFGTLLFKQAEAVMLMLGLGRATISLSQ
jgi:hypothetical protein